MKQWCALYVFLYSLKWGLVDKINFTTECLVAQPSTDLRLNILNSSFSDKQIRGIYFIYLFFLIQNEISIFTKYIYAFVYILSFVYIYIHIYIYIYIYMDFYVYIFDGIFLCSWNTDTLWTIVRWQQDTFQPGAKYCLSRSSIEPGDSRTWNTISWRPNHPPRYWIDH